jgi:hypothetical protein
MRRKFRIIIFIAAIIILENDLTGQTGEITASVNCPLEKVEVHLSQEGVLSGEILWFKIYCTSSAFRGEDLSNLAFIELISSQNNSILRKKILLKHGEGWGEFEIPDNLPTGLYYIIAYTNWMKNFGEESFFRKGISIINPYHKYTTQENIRDTLKSIIQSQEFTPGTVLLKVIPGKKKYSTRELVTLEISVNGLSGDKISGDISVSIYRKEPEMIYNTKKNEDRIPVKIPENIVYLPDYKGIRMSGKLTDPSGNAIPNALVTVSSPGPGTDLKGCITDNSGVFNFLLCPSEGEKEMVLTLPGIDTKSSLEESFWNGFRHPPENLYFSLDQEAVSYLTEKFTNFQIQSRFKKSNFTKSQQLKNNKDSSVFYSKPYDLIELRNYINLDSLREYLYELVPSVKFSGRKTGSEIMVFNPVTMSYLEDKPGIFIDGVPYDNFAEIAKIPVSNIDRIAVITSTYYYRDFTFGGIIDIHTKKSDFNGVALLPNMNRFIYPMADVSEWKFSFPDYSIAGSDTRIPDFRYLLFWEPNVRVEKSGEAIVQFYSGDIKGIYMIKVVGISDKGEIFQAENEISVND